MVHSMGFIPKTTRLRLPLAAPPSSPRFCSGQRNKLPRAPASSCVLCTPLPKNRDAPTAPAVWNAQTCHLLLGFYRQLSLASINLLAQSRSLFPSRAGKPVSSCCLHRMRLPSWHPQSQQCLLWKRGGRDTKQTEGNMSRSTQCQSHHNSFKVDT